MTSEEMNARLKEILNGVLAGAGLRAKHVCFQDYEESFYQIYDPSVRRAKGSSDSPFLYAGGSGEGIQASEQSADHPCGSVCRLRGVSLAGGEDWDENFLSIVKSALENRMISLVYLIGDGFSQEKMKESLSYICRGRRVFLGNNLFSKGACLGMMERLQNSPSGKAHVFLGDR